MTTAIGAMATITIGTIAIIIITATITTTATSIIITTTTTVTTTITGATTTISITDTLTTTESGWFCAMSRPGGLAKSTGEQSSYLRCRAAQTAARYRGRLRMPDGDVAALVNLSAL